MKDVEHGKIEDNAKKRGSTDLLPTFMILNMIMVFGCPPALGVNAKTKMIQDVRDALITRFNKMNLTCDIPQVFEHLKGKDVNFEMITSNTMQNLQLQYRHNIVAKSRAIIFVTEELYREGLGLKKLTY